MKRPLVSTLAAALFGAAALAGAAAAPAAATSGTAGTAGAATDRAPAAQAAPTFEGTVALSNCSGSVVKMPNSQPDDPALVLSNGHCLEGGMPSPGSVVVDQPSSRGFTLLNASGGSAGTIRADQVSYATMTDTDVSLYRTTSTYRQIEDRYGITPLELDAAHPSRSTAITVVSGYWRETYSCSIDDFVHELREAGWTMKDSIRYTRACQTKGGTSGSPVVDDATGKVVGVNNTGNENGERCTLNNPCEVDENGQVTVRQGINYGQQTYLIAPCVGANSSIDLSRPGCELPKP
ncbi:S1 family peptidase [Streptomyces boncukensis]|uniref:Trypsin-like peptidase domain-containing protein n=1 Tax=Streptomyces boncukensis TaxID=2711219 RepID=A0A6G4X7P2_9ACTN|nr:serine protease [Streptomyces boncukensis]NGO72870.1 trypsin-like peptidase domain-containing protein [Streptomyces boncukensis]